MKALIGIFAASVMLVSGSVVAGEDSGWYVGAGVGATEFEGDNDFSETTYGPMVIGGYQVNKYLAWEGEIEYSGEAKGDFRDDGGSGSVAVEYTHVAAGILGNIPIGNFGIFGRALAGGGKLTSVVSYNGVSDVNSSLDFGYVLGAGVSGQFGPVGVRLRYDYNHVSFDNGIAKPESVSIDALWRF